MQKRAHLVSFWLINYAAYGLTWLRYGEKIVAEAMSHSKPIFKIERLPLILIIYRNWLEWHINPSPIRRRSIMLKESYIYDELIGGLHQNHPIFVELSPCPPVNKGWWNDNLEISILHYNLFLLKALFSSATQI